MKLTKTTIDKMVYEKDGNAADYRWDDEIRGFCVRVYPSGERTFFVVYRNAQGSKRFYKLGRYGDITLAQGRELARKAKHNVAEGIDPQMERVEQRLEMTLADFAADYIDHVKERNRSWKDDQQRLRDHILPALGKRKLSEVSLRQLSELHTRLKGDLSPATANRCAALIKRMFNVAVEWGYLKESPALRLKMFKEPKPRDIRLTPDQCQHLLNACDADENVYAAALFKLAMFTGRRIGELLCARWRDLDLEAGVLTIPETKAGEHQFCYLNDAAVDVLRNLPRIDGNPYIVAGTQEGKPLVFYRRAWDRIVKRAGIDPIPPHGLRHNYASALVASGVPLETVGHLLGHKNSVTTRRYAHHRPDELRKAASVFSTVINLGEERRKRAS